MARSVTSVDIDRKDTSGSQRKVMDAERGACLRFLDQVVRENKDQVFAAERL